MSSDELQYRLIKAMDDVAADGAAGWVIAFARADTDDWMTYRPTMRGIFPTELAALTVLERETEAYNEGLEPAERLVGVVLPLLPVED